MRISRNSALKITFFLDQCIPPIIRDARWFAPIFFRFVYKEKAHIFLEFKGKALDMTEREFVNTYREIESVLMERETDLNDMSMAAILDNIVGETVLEVGAGKCLLAKKISKKHRVTACDIVFDPSRVSENLPIRFREGNIEKLPFEPAEFDTVVCTHTLEHVQNLFLAISELRRVARRRIIIVVPKQRPYKYTFDLHLHFFPYEHSLHTVMGPGRKYSCREVGGDWLYVEDCQDREVPSRPK